jgi:formamidopyrimidine-DNA glycosylase
MPELPEVETIVRELNECLKGKVVLEIEELYPGTVVLLTEQEDCTPRTVIKVGRKGKYIVIYTSGATIVVHLRMTGKLIHNCNTGVANHVRAIMHLNDGSEILFDDVRTFGKIYILNDNDLKVIEDKLGPEPFSCDFSPEYLQEKLKSLTSSIKTVLLNQKIVAGLGNIYVNEILYMSGISPLRKANTLNTKEIEQIIKCTRKILRKAIECNGTTISDFRRVDDKSGTFQNFLSVYGKKTCLKGHDIRRLKTCGRSTYYCPKCQGDE